jgi:hypothetical protein
LLADNGFQDISRFGDVREVDLGLNFVAIRTYRTRRFTRRGRFTAAVEVGPHFVSFVVFQGTRMGLFLGDSNLWKYIKNGLALDFQFSGQIVDSNLAHPPSFSSELSR